MKRSTRSFARTSNIHESVHQQLKMYVLAAVVAVGSLLALSKRSEARIVYTPANVHIGVDQHYHLDLKNDGVTDYTIQNVFSQRNGQCPIFKDSFDYLAESPAQGNGAVLANSWAKALSRGVEIGPNQIFGSADEEMANGSVHFVYRQGQCAPIFRTSGPWVNVSNRYLGLKFRINGKTHYGRARLSVQKVGYFRINATLMGYAYETIAGKSIRAGQTKGMADDFTSDDPETENVETPDEKPVFDIVLRHPDILPSRATAPDSTCTNCLIWRCLVRNGKLFGGYCLEGARGGICHESYDPHTVAQESWRRGRRRNNVASRTSPSMT